MNNGLLTLSSNGALRYDPVRNNLILGDNDGLRAVLGSNVMALGEGNTLNGVQDNSIIMGSSNLVDGGQGIFGSNSKNVVIGSGNQLGANTLSTSDGNCVVIGTNNNAGSYGAATLFKGSSVTIGYKNTNQSTQSVVIGYNCSGSTNSVVIGTGSSTSSTSIVLGPNSASTGTSSMVFGQSASDNGKSYVVTYAGARPHNNNSIAFAASSNTQAQAETTLATMATTDASSQDLWTNTTLSTKFGMANDTTAGFTGIVVGRNTTNDAESSVWQISGAIRRGTTAASVTLIGTPTVTLMAQDSTAAAWVVVVGTDATNGGLRITVTGEAGKNIRWSARVDFMYVTA